MKTAYRTGWCGSGNHARCTGSAGTPDRRAQCACPCHGDEMPTTRTVTVKVEPDLSVVRDELTKLGDLCFSIGDLLYAAAAPDTDVTDEDAIARRTINNPVIREAADTLAAQGVDVGVEKL